MARLRLAFLVLATSPLVLQACKSPVRIDTLAGLALNGVVTDSTGAAVAGAIVVGFGTPGTRCASRGAPGQPDTTDAAGFYELLVTTTNDDFEGCVRIVVMPPPGAALAPSTVDRLGVLFRTQWPPDTVRVDVALRAGA